MTVQYRARVLIELMDPDDKNETGWQEVFQVCHSQMPSPDGAAQAAADSLEALIHSIQRGYMTSMMPGHDCSMGLGEATDELRGALSEVEGLLGFDGSDLRATDLRGTHFDREQRDMSNFHKGAQLRRFQRDFPGGPWGYAAESLRPSVPPPGLGGLGIVPTQPTSGQPANGDDAPEGGDTDGRDA